MTVGEKQGQKLHIKKNTCARLILMTCPDKNSNIKIPCPVGYFSTSSKSEKIKSNFKNLVPVEKKRVKWKGRGREGKEEKKWERKKRGEGEVIQRENINERERREGRREEGRRCRGGEKQGTREGEREKGRG